MSTINKKDLSESDICDLYITPAIIKAGWVQGLQVRREVCLTPGPVVVRGNMSARNKKKRKFADYVLSWEPGVPVAVVEAKDNCHTVSQGMQQALGYAEILQVPSAFSSNGDAFASHNKTPLNGKDIETEFPLDNFPSPTELWKRYKKFHGIQDAEEELLIQPYYSDGSGKEPRYYQMDAINRIIAMLEDNGILLENLAEEVGREYSDFDLICHIAFDQLPLTRQERANNVRKRNYFTKYGEQARAVLNALLDKYADKGIITIENPKVLNLSPFKNIGTPVEIINKVFGGRENYEKAIRELEQELFKQDRTA